MIKRTKKQHKKVVIFFILLPGTRTHGRAETVEATRTNSRVWRRREKRRQRKVAAVEAAASRTEQGGDDAGPGGDSGP